MFEKVPLKDWYEGTIGNDLSKIRSLVDSANAETEEKMIVRYWWNAFHQNSFCLCALIARKEFHYQIAMTLRLLMEIAADVCFVKNYPQNAHELVKSQREIAKKMTDSDYTLRKSAKDTSTIRLYEYNGNGSRGEPVNTQERLSRAFDDGQKKESDIMAIYGVVSRSSHFNHMTAIWEGNKQNSDNSANEALKDNLRLFSFYPIFLSRVVIDIGEILSVDELENYDFSKVRQAVDDMENWRARSD